MPTFHRGEVWLVDLGYAAKVRPCLILSEQSPADARALVALVPHTTQPRGSRFEVSASVPFLRTGVFDAQNVVTAAEAKLLRKIGDLPADALTGIESAVREWLGLV